MVIIFRIKFFAELFFLHIACCDVLKQTVFPVLQILLHISEVGMNIEKNCAFTGHRPNSFIFGYNEEHPDCIRLKQRLYQEIENMFAKGVNVFISGGALGVDMWAMEAVLELKKKEPSVRLVAAVPFRGQEKRWRAEQIARYEGLLAQCDKVACFSEVYHSRCYHDRNRMMVDNAANLIAVYDGKGEGGTAYTVNYARGLGRNIVIIDPNRRVEEKFFKNFFEKVFTKLKS